MANSALSEVQAANLTANSTASTAASNLSNSFSSVGQLDKIDAGGFRFLFWTMGENSLAGLNTDKVDSMKSAVKTYVDNVNSVLDKLETLDASNSFGQKVGQVVATYVASVKNACKALNSNLEAFCEDLTAIKATYEAKAQSMSSAVENTSSEMDSAASQYKYSGGSR